MEFKIYNSLTRKIENFVPNGNVVTLYTCGPTVYHFAHIGNLRSYIMEDVLQKSLEYVGYKVKRAMNITDVGHLSSDGDEGEDKMLLGAERENKTIMEIAQFYTNAFKKDCELLNIKWPEIVVPATSCIDEYINIIKVLIEKNFAYISNGNVYFDVSKLDNYYSLTNQKSDDMKIGVRESVNEDLGKKNPQDFVLWFTKSKFENHALKWDSPWGVGYPGWHIECSGISHKYLGEKLDIHCGGVDNKFPHHTNEIAQSESFLGHKWCNYWFHVEHLNVASGKMSKSKGEFLTVSSLIEKGYKPQVYRLFCLMSHYRKVLTFSFEALDHAKSAYEGIVKKLETLKEDASPLNKQEIEKFDSEFKKVIANDINTSSAITVLYDVLKSSLNNNSKIYLVKKFDEVLGLSLSEYIGKNAEKESVKVDANFEKYILQKIEERKQAKLNKNYSLADSIRNQLLERGVILIDTKEGTTFEIK